jgi:NTP pyrophosphatase (non-canonical NTP hydrolase)
MTALDDVLDERMRQDKIWGEQNHPIEWYYMILMEEVGEVARAVLNTHFGGEDPGAIRDELVHATAVGLAIIECIDRRNNG